MSTLDVSTWRIQTPAAFVAFRRDEDVGALDARCLHELLKCLPSGREDRQDRRRSSLALSLPCISIFRLCALARGDTLFADFHLVCSRLSRALSHRIALATDTGGRGTFGFGIVPAKILSAVARTGRPVYFIRMCGSTGRSAAGLAFGFQPVVESTALRATFILPKGVGTLPDPVLILLDHNLLQRPVRGQTNDKRPSAWRSRHRLLIFFQVFITACTGRATLSSPA